MSNISSRSSPATGAVMPWRLPSTVAFGLLAMVLFTFFFAASAPSPLFVVFQHAWGFSSSMLTVAFAVYALALMLSLVVAGSLSDHIGRRPVVVAALVLQAVAMGMFLLARGIGGLIAARIVQGVATGIASGALSAAVVEAAPEARKRLGALVGSVAPLAGLAVGALATGAAVRFGSQPVPWVFGLLGLCFALGAALALFMPESVAPRAGALASLMPRVSVPTAARGAFVRAVPVLVAVWALGGVFLSLVPSVLLHVFEVDNGLVNGLAIAVLSGVGAVAPTVLGRLHPARIATIGMVAIALGLGLLLGAIGMRSLGLFFAGTAVAGIGFGAAFSATIQTLAPLAEPGERGELFAAIFVASYLAFSVPAMVAGLLVAPFGLLATVRGYAGLLLVLAVVGAMLQGVAAPHARRRS